MTDMAEVIRDAEVDQAVAKAKEGENRKLDVIGRMRLGKFPYTIRISRLELAGCVGTSILTEAATRMLPMTAAKSGRRPTCTSAWSSPASAGMKSVSAGKLTAQQNTHRIQL